MTTRDEANRILRSIPGSSALTLDIANVQHGEFSGLVRIFTTRVGSEEIVDTVIVEITSPNPTIGATISYVGTPCSGSRLYDSPTSGWTLLTIHNVVVTSIRQYVNTAFAVSRLTPHALVSSLSLGTSSTCGEYRPAQFTVTRNDARWHGFRTRP